MEPEELPPDLDTPRAPASSAGTRDQPSAIHPPHNHTLFFARRLPQSRSLWWCCLSHASVECSPRANPPPRKRQSPRRAARFRSRSHSSARPPVTAHAANGSARVRMGKVNGRQRQRDKPRSTTDTPATPPHLSSVAAGATCEADSPGAARRVDPHASPLPGSPSLSRTQFLRVRPWWGSA